MLQWPSVDLSSDVAYMFQDLSQLLDETLLNEEQGAYYIFSMSVSKIKVQPVN